MTKSKMLVTIFSATSIMLSNAAFSIDTNSLSNATGTTNDPQLYEIPMSELVADAMASAEETCEKSGVEYYGKESAGILGNRLWFIDAGATFSNTDEDGVDIDPGFNFSTGFNFPLAKYLDLGIGLSHSQRSGTFDYYEIQKYYTYSYYSYYYYTIRYRRTRYRYIWHEQDFDSTTFSGSASLALSLAPGKPINPFIIGGGLFMNQDFDAGSFSDTVSETGYFAGAGIEFMIGNKFSLIPSGVYSEVDDITDTAINIQCAHWYAFRQAIRIGASYGTESKDTAARLGWMYSF